jgi:hypothetical protein
MREEALRVVERCVADIVELSCAVRRVTLVVARPWSFIGLGIPFLH